MRPFSPPPGTYGACHFDTAGLRHPLEAAFIVRFEQRPTVEHCADMAVMITHLPMFYGLLLAVAEADHREEFQDARADAKKLLQRPATYRQPRGGR